MARQDQHAVLAGMQPVAPRVVAAGAVLAADVAIAVEIQTARYAGVDRGEVAVRVVEGIASTGLGHVEVVTLEQVGRDAAGIVVELVEQHDVRPHPLQHRRDLARVGVAGTQALNQAAGSFVVQRGVVGGDPQWRACGIGHVVRVSVDRDPDAAGKRDRREQAGQCPPWAQGSGGGLRHAAGVVRHAGIPSSRSRHCRPSNASRGWNRRLYSILRCPPIQ